MELELDVKKMGAVKRTLDPKLVKKAEPRAINKVAQIARTAQSKEIRKIYNIPAKRLNEGLERVSGPNRATVRNPRAIIRVKKLSKRNPGLQHFGAKQTKKGISYRILKAKSRTTRLHAFKSESILVPGIFLRKGKERLPIKRQIGPSIIQMMKRVGIEPVRLVARTRMQRQFMHEYRRELDKVRR